MTKGMSCVEPISATQTRHPQCRSLFLRFLVSLGPEAVTGAVDEDVLERGLADAHRLDFSRKCFDDPGNETMAVLQFDANVIVEDGGLHLEAGTDALAKRGSIAGRVQQDHVPPDLALQFRGSAHRDQLAF